MVGGKRTISPRQVVYCIWVYNNYIKECHTSQSKYEHHKRFPGINGFKGVEMKHPKVNIWS